MYAACPQFSDCLTISQPFFADLDDNDMAAGHEGIFDVAVIHRLECLGVQQLYFHVSVCRAVGDGEVCAVTGD